MSVRPTSSARPSVARDDERLMTQIAGGDDVAFDKLYHRYRVIAHRMARSVCRDDGRAEDAVQEAFVGIWRNRATYLSQRGTVATWLLTVVRYRAIDIARHDLFHAAHQAGDEQLETLPATGDAADRAMARDDMLAVRSLLIRLPNAQREAITLAFYGELSYTEIAALLELPAGTVKGRMRLGLHKLRRDIVRFDPDSPMAGCATSWCARA